MFGQVLGQDVRCTRETKNYSLFIIPNPRHPQLYSNPKLKVLFFFLNEFVRLLMFFVGNIGKSEETEEHTRGGVVEGGGAVPPLACSHVILCFSYIFL